MAHIVFYEKTGCINNTKQKKLLMTAGHTLDVRNLLTTRWSADSLRQFFKGKRVKQWFNMSSPLVKSGKIKPEEMTEERALALMTGDPLLIRRPLMVIEGVRYVGFDVEALTKQINMVSIAVNQDLELCPRSHARESSDDGEDT